MTVRATKDRKNDIKPDTARRLARIVEQHSPYGGDMHQTTGGMCRECGYLHPCPTRRMGTEADPAGPWLISPPETPEPENSNESEVEIAEDGGEELAAAAHLP